jgi:hypothetical protein
MDDAPKTRCTEEIGVQETRFLKTPARVLNWRGSIAVHLLSFAFAASPLVKVNLKSTALGLGKAEGARRTLQL